MKKTTLLCLGLIISSFVLACGQRTNAPESAQTSPTATAKPSAEALQTEKPKFEYLRLNAEQLKTQTRMQMEMAAQKKNCHIECNGCRTVCVPGCDPPDRDGTVHGCSSCYSREIVCDVCREVCP
jgi:hypothetical protein